MFATAHTFAGITIATLLLNLWLAIPLSLISHFALDMVPHWDFFAFKDNITKTDKVKTVCALANLPDACEAPYIFFGKTNRSPQK